MVWHNYKFINTNIFADFGGSFPFGFRNFPQFVQYRFSVWLVADFIALFFHFSTVFD